MALSLFAKICCLFDSAMASMGYGHSVAVLISDGSVSCMDIKLDIQRKPQSGMAWLPFAVMLPNKTHVARCAMRMPQRVTGLP
jgi:hypothetical protein